MKHPQKALRAAIATGLLAAFCVSGAAAAGTAIGAGDVTAQTTLNFREKPSTESAVLASIPASASLVVFEKTEGGWYKVVFGQKEGFVSADYLAFSQQLVADLGSGRVDATSLNLRSGPGTNSSILASIPDNTVVDISGIDGSWYQVNYQGYKGYVLSQYVDLLNVAEDAAPAPTPSADLSQQEAVVAFSKEFLGCKYVYADEGPSTFDCSGFTYYVYGQFGISLNRSSADQLRNGTAVELKDIQLGDLVLFKANTTRAASHVGLYIGDGQFIHASSAGGEVKINNLSDNWYAKHFVGVRRVL